MLHGIHVFVLLRLLHAWYKNNSILTFCFAFAFAFALLTVNRFKIYVVVESTKKRARKKYSRNCLIILDVKQFSAAVLESWKRFQEYSIVLMGMRRLDTVVSVCMCGCVHVPRVCTQMHPRINCQNKLITNADVRTLCMYVTDSISHFTFVDIFFLAETLPIPQ